MYQMRLPESCRQKEEERKYIRYGKSKQRCTLYFEDKNSMETNLCEHAIIVNDVR